jgi:hypothetical protein
VIGGTGDHHMIQGKDHTMRYGIISVGLLVAFLATAVAPLPAHAFDEPDLGGESIAILAPFFNQGYWWDHGTLTVRIKAAGNVDPSEIDAVREALAIWNAAIAHRHGPIVELVDVSGDRAAAPKADIVVSVHAQGGALFGVATCASGRHCQVRLWDGERAQGKVGYPMTYAEMVSLATHELGHALGLGHVDPLTGTMDIMGYGTADVVFPPAVISACDMDAIDVVWAWAIVGTEPVPPTVEQIACT